MFFILGELNFFEFGNDLQGRSRNDVQKYSAYRKSPKYPSQGVQSKFYPNGKPEYVGQMKNGTKHGKGVLYAPDGNVAYVGNFDHGEMNGTAKMYYNNEKDSILFNGTLINGNIKEGIVYDPKGEILNKKDKDQNEEGKNSYAS